MQRHETCLGRPHGGTLYTTFGAFVCVFVGMLMLGWSVSLECLLFGSEMPFDCFCCEPRFVFLDHFNFYVFQGFEVYVRLIRVDLFATPSTDMHSGVQR